MLSVIAADCGNVALASEVLLIKVRNAATFWSIYTEPLFRMPAILNALQYKCAASSGQGQERADVSLSRGPRETILNKISPTGLKSWE
jgi:hypothetical protein